MLRKQFGACIVAAILALASAGAAGAAEGSGAGNAAACLGVVDGGMYPNSWKNSCDFAVTVKWFDEAYCDGGCQQTLERDLTPFNDLHGTYAFVACRGTEGPVGFDAIDDSDYACPGDAAAAAGVAATGCVSILDPGGMMLPTVWENGCDGPVAVKWFDDGDCADGCTAVLVDETTPFPGGTEETAFAACLGETAPSGFDGPGDADWTCP